MIQEHGGNIYGYGDILDFSSNINLLGPPESVREAYLESAAIMDRYPDSLCTELRSKLSMHCGLPAENIVCGNGAADLIYRAIHALKPKSALLCRPCFREYEKALAETGFTIPLVITISYAFLAIRFDDTSILDFLRYAINYFFLEQQEYRWQMRKGDE